MERIVMRRHIRVAGLFLALAMMAGACTGASDAGPGSTDVSGPTETAEPETTTTEPKVLPEFSEATRPSLEIPDTYQDDLDEILERYLLYKDARINAAGPPFADPDDPTLAGLITGERAETTKSLLQELQDDGLVFVLPKEGVSESRVQFAQQRIGPKKVEGNTILLQDCETDDLQIIRLSDGEVLEDEIFTTLWNIRMLFTDGQWRVAAVSIEKEYEGVSECVGDFVL